MLSPHFRAASWDSQCSFAFSSSFVNSLQEGFQAAGRNECKLASYLCLLTFALITTPALPLFRKVTCGKTALSVLKFAVRQSALIAEPYSSCGARTLLRHVSVSHDGVRWSDSSYHHREDVSKNIDTSVHSLPSPWACKTDSPARTGSSKETESLKRKKKTTPFWVQQRWQGRCKTQEEGRMGPLASPSWCFP